jgi:hypothetical protein
MSIVSDLAVFDAVVHVLDVRFRFAAVGSAKVHLFLLPSRDQGYDKKKDFRQKMMILTQNASLYKN